ncbi:UbiA family prenyltransferase [bacterium]|nr:UbiA family prenyltransferase [bacterium]
MKIVVDLDKSLLKTDLFVESFFKLIFSKPWLVFKVLKKLIISKSKCKSYVASNININPQNLPYNKRVLDLVTNYKNKGNSIILSTGAPRKHAEQIYNYLNIFEEFYSSTNEINNVGIEKLKSLKKNNIDEFIYLGDSNKDFQIWNFCKKAIVVNLERKKINKLKKMGVKIYQEINTKQNTFSDFLKQIRIHQWLKNILLFVPTFAAHEIFNLSFFVNCVAAFLSFSLIASSVYIYNDFLDLDNDRSHITKKHRPLSSAKIDSLTAAFLMSLLFLVGFIISFKISFSFFVLCSIYIILNVLYSGVFKKIIAIDIILLSFFYMVRLFGGFVINDTEFSIWLTGFLFGVFLSLGSMKRFIEIIKLKEKPSGRGYLYSDLSTIQTIGISSGIIAALILILYSVSENVFKLYNSPQLILLVVPLYLYWILRIWILASRKVVNMDPVVFIIKDPPTYVILLLSSLTFLLASII